MSKHEPIEPLGAIFKERLIIELFLGNFLLSHILCSTIGASGLNFSVRNGKRCNTAVIVTFLSID